jgi:biotin carboxylase
MVKRILILGAGIMQGPAIRFAKERGLEAVVVDGDPKAPCSSWADIFVPIDLKDRESIATYAKNLLRDGGLGGVLTAGTDFSATVAYVAEKVGLPGIPYQNALDASDKERMRRRFKEASVPSPDFVALTEIPASPSGLPFPFPVVVKPVDNMGSRGCRRVNRPEALGSAVEDALRFSRSGRAIVEEFMEGPEFSLDAVVYRGQITLCGIADRHIFFPPFFIEMGHTMPTQLELGAQKRIIDVFFQAIRALGITHGAAKGDIKLTPQGPMVGEIAARLSGGYMSGWTYPYASGVEPVRAAIAVALGDKPEGLEPLRRWTSAERAFISIPGTVKTILGLGAVKKLPRIKDLFVRVAPGSTVQFPVNNVSKCGNIISAAPDRPTAVQTAEDAVRSIFIRLEPHSASTDAFLRAPLDEPFPPSAFTPKPVLLRALESLGDPTIDPRDLGDSFRGIGPALVPFSQFTEGSFTDYVGRTVQESLTAVRRISGYDLPLVEPSESGERPRLGRKFWSALIRGGYQGALYLLDSLASDGAR